LGFYVARLAEGHFRRVIIGFGAVAVFALDVIHQMEPVIEVDEVGELINARRRDLGVPGDLRMTESALGDGRVSYLRSELRGSGVAVGAHQLRSRDMRLVTEGRE
jgi:hypothetical protein